MATIVLGDNAGAGSTILSYDSIDVTLKDGEGATLIATYDDIDALAEVARLFAEAHSKLLVAKADNDGTPAAPERRQYALTDEQVKRLTSASRPVPYLVIGGVEPASSQQNANAFWRALGERRGFDWTTVQAVPGVPQNFTAIANGPDEDAT